MIKPTKDRVIVEVKEEPEKIGSLYVPDTAKNKPKAKAGIVLAIGPDQDNVEVGETIIFEKYSGAKIDKLQDNVLIINNSDIIAICV